MKKPMHMEVFDKDELKALGHELMNWGQNVKKLPPMKFVSFLIYFTEILKKDMGVSNILKGDVPENMT